jgi:hypothetical protein
MHIVRLGASRINGLGWKTYDEQFRLKMGIDPVKSWEIVHERGHEKGDERNDFLHFHMYFYSDMHNKGDVQNN